VQKPTFEYPRDLHDFISSNLDAWIDSAVRAKFVLKEDNDYIVALDKSDG